jgi:protein-tyrosine kinase
MSTLSEEAIAVTKVPAEALSFSFSDEVVVIADANGVQAESISALRSHLIAKHIESGRRALAICACDANDMAVDLAVNLAVSLAQANLRTLLIDCDLRSPRVQNFIRPSFDVPGLHDLLEDETQSIGAIIQSGIVPELAVMFAGNPTGNAQELLFSNRFAQTIDLCLRDFDVTIAVTPPSKWFADTRHIATLMSYALVVARKDKTLMSDVKTLVDELKLDGVRVIGSVYNAF